MSDMHPLAQIDFSGIALAVSALGTLVTAVGIAIVAVMTARQKRVIEQVEEQGNSVSLELKRTNMVFSRRLALETRREADIAIADDSQTVYEEAKKQVDAKKLDGKIGKQK